MAMDEKRVHLTYYYWGLCCLSMVVLGLLSGRTLSFDEDDLKLVDFATITGSPIEFYAMTALYALIAVTLFYKSLLFIGINREDLITHDGFDRRVVGLEKPAHGLSFSRIITVAFFSLLIVAAVYMIYFQAELLLEWLIDTPEEPINQRPERIDCF